MSDELKPALSATLFGLPVVEVDMLTPKIELSGDLNASLLELGLELALNRNGYVKAWLAETGLLPSQCELVERRTDEGAVITIRERRSP